MFRLLIVLGLSIIFGFLLSAFNSFLDYRLCGTFKFSSFFIESILFSLLFFNFFCCLLNCFL